MGDAEESEDHKQQVEYFKAMLPHLLVPKVGEETVRAAAGLTEYADHLHSIQYAGILPKDYEIYMEFENFHLTPVIAEFLQMPESPEEGTWTVLGEGCTMEGDCIQSKNYPEYYDNSEECIIVATAVKITVDAFATEDGY